jgi:energy-coupling factor transporter transmembrane protein EcfT
MNKYLSHLINFSVLLFIVSLFFFKSLSLLILIASLGLVFFSLHKYGYKNPNLILLLLILLITGSFYFVNNFPLASLNNAKKDAMNAVTQNKTDIDSKLMELARQIQRGQDGTSTLSQLEGILNVAKNQATDTDPNSYLELARVYESAAVLGVQGAADLTMISYSKFCLLRPSDPECYASIARFLILDKTNKEIALKYAQKALTFATGTEANLEKYKSLVEYISKL